MKRKEYWLMWAAIVAGALVYHEARAVSGDTAAYPPYVATPVPDQTVQSGAQWNLNGYFYIPCTTEQGATDPYAATFALSPAVPGVTINPTTGQVSGTPTGSVSGVEIRCTTPGGTVADTFNLTVQPGQAPVIATGYFVDCSLASNGNGTLASPWNNIGTVNSGVTATGSDVWFKAGTTCSNQTLSVDWPGASGDRVVVGTYYVSGGGAYQLVPNALLANPMDQAYSNGTRAVIQGSYRASCRAWQSSTQSVACLWNASGAVPSQHYGALIYVNAVPYVTIQDIEVRDSAGVGIFHDGVAAGNWCYPSSVDCQDYSIIQRAKVSHVANCGILNQESQYSIIRENEVEFVNLAWLDNKYTSNFWCTGISTIRSAPAYALIENNYVHDIGKGEGIGPYTTGHVLVRGNRLANRVIIYFDGDNDIVSEQNTVVGGDATIEAGLGDPAKVSSAADDGSTVSSFTKEPPETSNGSTPLSARRHVVRNNLGANTSGFQFGIDSSAGGTQIDGVIAGNTTVGGFNSSQLRINNYQVPASSIGPLGLKAQNNIFASTSGYANCYASQTSLAGITTDYNFWTGTPIGQNPGASAAGCMSPGTHDIHSTFAALLFASGYAHFGDADKTTFPEYTDFQVQAGSAVANAGVAMTDNILINGEWTWVLSQRQWKPSCQSAQVAESEFVKALTTDYCGVARTTNFMGALKPL